MTSSKFIKLLVIALRTAASSGGDERTVLRLLRIYGRTRQLRGLDSHSPLRSSASSSAASSSAASLLYPTDLTFMGSVETAFEERVAQIATSAKSNNEHNKTTLLAECSPFDQAMASVLLMNDGRPLNGTVIRRLQVVCENLTRLTHQGPTTDPETHRSGAMSNTSNTNNMNNMSNIVWPRVCDRLLVQGIEEGWSNFILLKKKMIHVLQVHKQDIRTSLLASLPDSNSSTSNSSRALDDILASYEQVDTLKSRTKWLKWLNEEILAVLPLADFDKPGLFVRLLSLNKDLILHRTKRTFMQSHFKKRRRARERSGLVLHLNRFLPTNLFTQAFGQLTRYGGEWINFKKPWKVVFDGEGGSDAGGPGRESVTAIMESLFKDSHNLFVPTPNDADASSSGTSDQVLREDRWLASPRFQNRHRPELELVGKLLGMSFREQWSVPVRLARSIWRQLLGFRKTILDLKEEDYSQYYLLQELKELAPEDIESMGLDFTVRLSDNRVKPLTRNGQHISVDHTNVQDYLLLAKKRRLEESKSAIASIIRGFACVVPLSVVRSLYTWNQLENEVCGVSELNVERLKTHTSWPAGLDASVEKIFWEVLHSFDAKQSANFLRFCWGRTRLPQDPEKTFMMRVKPLVARGAWWCGGWCVGEYVVDVLLS